MRSVVLAAAAVLVGLPQSALAEPIDRPVSFETNERIALVGNSLAERMGKFGYFEARLHTRLPQKELLVRNFGWPADEVGKQQRPSNYTAIDDPLEVFGPDTLICFFGFNESFAGTSDEAIVAFKSRYERYIAEQTKRFAAEGQKPRFVLVSPVAFEATGDRYQSDGTTENTNLLAYTQAIAEVAQAGGHRFINLFHPTLLVFGAEAGNQYTIDGAHLNEAGDRFVGQLLDDALFDVGHPTGDASRRFELVRKWVNDKSWFHNQDYRMLNGWYVYGGRRTWDTETFPTEYQKIRKIVAVRDRYIWDLAAGRDVPEQPDDSGTGEVFEPETMFGTRNENFRKMREPEELVYPTPEESIGMMTVPEGMRVELFASEREFPELANPNQIAFDSRGRLWVSCMANYPQWQPGATKPDDRLLIFEDTDGDGKADECITFYDKLICPTGFEFWDGGVLVVDEPRILFLKDTDGDSKADLVRDVLDGIATDDTHHTVGAWEFSHGGQLHMLEGVQLSTTMETARGPFRNSGTAGCYVLDPRSMKIEHFRTPGYGNPWCLVFDEWGNGMVGDGTNAKQHWTSPLSGYEVESRRTLQPNFDNEGMRPAVGNEFLTSRHLPDEMQDQFIYACVINMHGMPRFNLRDEEGGAGFEGERVEDLLSSTDMIFRPVDPKIGPDGAVWFGDWCNALIGHMQYSQRDPNRDHAHGRIYRLVNTDKPLLEPVMQAGRSVPELLDQLKAYELRTRYRARRELWSRDRDEVLSAAASWLGDSTDPRLMCEVLWLQESFHAVETDLIDRLLASDDFHARAAALHVLVNDRDRQPDLASYLAEAIADPHPRVRLEAVRGYSFLRTPEALQQVLSVADRETDYWIDYTLEHALHAMEPVWRDVEKREDFLASSSDAAKRAFTMFRQKTGPGGAVVEPLAVATSEDAAMGKRKKAVRQLAGLKGGSAKNGAGVFKQVCSACHVVGDMGKKFGPSLDGVGHRLSREEIIASIVMPNEKISKGYETVKVLTDEGQVQNGFILKETETTLSLGIANGKQVDIDKDSIEARKEMKASSMPEGLMKTIAPIEFLDLVSFLASQTAIKPVRLGDGWIKSSQPDPKLRTMNGQREISRDAAIKLGPSFKNDGWNNDAHLFLTDVPRERWDFAFHSEHDAESPHVTIRFDESRTVKTIWLRNRPGFVDRAEGLTIWASRDGDDFEKVWTVGRLQEEWGVELASPVEARYLRIGLEGKGTFHLYQAAVFGE